MHAAAACRGEVKLKLSREHGSSEEHWGARGGKHGDELTEYQLDCAIGPSADNAEASASLILLAAVNGHIPSWYI